MLSSAARVPLVLNGITLDCSPLDDESQDALNEWVRDRYLDQVAKMAEKLKNNETKQSMLLSATQFSVSLTWASEMGAQLLASVDGIARIVYESCRKNHPNITYEQIKQHMLDPAAIRKANQMFKQVQGVPQGKKQPPGKRPNPLQKQKQRTRRNKST